MPDSPAPQRPWAVRLVRSCSEWAGADAHATSTHVFGCDGAIFDRESGQLIDARPGRSAPSAAIGDVTLWASDFDEPPVLVARDAALHASPPIALPERGSIEASGDGRPIFVGRLALFEIDLTAHALRPIEGSEACTEALAVGRARSGAPQCIVRCGEGDRAACLRTVGVEREIPLGDLYGATAMGEGRFFLQAADATARVIGDDGATIATHEAVEGIEVRDVSADAVLLALAETTELWRVDGDALEAETVYGRRADQASFAGDEIVLASHQSLLWLHRGEPRHLSELPPPTAPRGFVALRPTVDGASASFEGDDGSVIGRGTNDVAAFEATGRRFAQVTVSRSDAAELARFDDDAAWAAAAASRYVDPGSQRWAKTWRGPEGRVMRGHAYIGGCERTHIDVELRERGGVLERWRVYSGQGEGMDAILGATPADARAVPSVRGDSYQGDPSTGRW